MWNEAEAGSLSQQSGIAPMACVFEPWRQEVASTPFTPTLSRRERGKPDYR